MSLLKEVQRKKIPFYQSEITYNIINTKTKLELDEDVKIEILHPPPLSKEFRKTTKTYDAGQEESELSDTDIEVIKRDKDGRWRRDVRFARKSARFARLEDGRWKRGGGRGRKARF